MTVKTKVLTIFFIVTMCCLLWAKNASGDIKSSGKQLFTCGMHPQVVKDAPGECPLCNMKLTVAHSGASVESSANGVIAVDATIAQRVGIRSEPVRRGALTRTIRAYGTVGIDETRLHEVTTLFRGRIEKVFVDSVGQSVRKGDPLCEVFSPEVLTAQTEYMMTLNMVSNSPSALSREGTLRPTNAAGLSPTGNMGTMGNSARMRAASRLKAFDFTDEQIARLERGHDGKKGISIPSPVNGFVLEKAIVPGQVVESGMRLLRVADLSVVWLQAQIYAEDLAQIQMGQEAEITLFDVPGPLKKARVTSIDSALDEKTRSARIRLEIPNTDFAIKPGMLATVELQAALKTNALLVTESAILRTGHKDTVFLALDHGQFAAREVKLGRRGDGDVYEVLDGLNEGESVVASGQFMLDSESQFRTALYAMTAPARATPTEMEPQNAEEPKTSGKIVYTCPMAEHAAIRNERPGKCPLCNMTLTPVSEAAYGKMAEERWRKEHPGRP